MAYEFTVTENPALSRVDAILKRLQVRTNTKAPYKVCYLGVFVFYEAKANIVLPNFVAKALSSMTSEISGVPNLTPIEFRL